MGTPTNPGRRNGLILALGTALVLAFAAWQARQPLDPLDPDAPAVLDLLRWHQAYADAARQLYGASVNALAGSSIRVPPSPIPSREEMRAELLALPAGERACAICRELRPAPYLPPLPPESTAVQLALSAYALRAHPIAEGDPLHELPPPGLTLGELRARACGHCPDAGPDPFAAP